MNSFKSKNIVSQIQDTVIFNNSYTSFFLGLLIVLLFNNTVIYAQKDKPLPLIIDADTANEIDDLYAIVRALAEPKFKVLGISSAQYNTSPLATACTVCESQKINEDILKLMHKTDISLPKGSNVPLEDAQTAAVSAASKFIIKTASQFSKQQKLNIVVLGSCTNIASAIIEDPSIISKIKVHYIGFWHNTSTNSYDKKEFNTGNDPLAVEVLLNTKGLDFNIMTATTSQHLIFKKKEIDKHLKDKGGIADYLVNRWETYHRWWTKEDPEKKEWIMWDVAIIEALAHPELADKKQFLTPKENTQRHIDIYTSINVDAMINNFWKSLEKI